MNWSHRFPLLVALLLVSSAVLFAVGTAIEHSQRAGHHETHAEAPPAAEGGETPPTKTGGESSGEATGTKSSGESGHTEATPSPSGTEANSEKIAGVDPESWPLVGLAIGISLLVAAGVYWRRGRWLVAAAAFGILFAAADTRELVHQINESRTTVAAIAGTLIALHLLVALAATAARATRAGRDGQTVSVT